MALYGEKKLMQFTGFYDLNLDEIYDGDIIELCTFSTRIRDNYKITNSEHTNTYLITYSNESNCWSIECIKTTLKSNFGIGNKTNSFLDNYTNKSKIIGNIYSFKL